VNALNPVDKLRLRSATLGLVAIPAGRHDVLGHVADLWIYTINAIVQVIAAMFSFAAGLRFSARRCTAIKAVIFCEFSEFIAHKPELMLPVRGTVDVTPVEIRQAGLTVLFSVQTRSLRRFPLNTSATSRIAPGPNNFVTTVALKPESSYFSVAFERAVWFFRHFLDHFKSTYPVAWLYLSFDHKKTC
jgi:hypothetical protein